MENNKKEELFDKIIGLKYVRQGVPKNWYNKGVDDSFRYIKNFFDKEFVPEVPQYVADWYERNKGNLDYNLWNYIMDWDDTKEDDFKKWLNSSRKAFQTIINMHQFGYKVEKEKQYTVKIKAFLGQYLERYYLTNEILTPQFKRTQPIGGDKLPTFTRKELEQTGFGWVFDCPGVEVEEVEE